MNGKTIKRCKECNLKPTLFEAFVAGFIYKASCRKCGKETPVSNSKSEVRKLWNSLNTKEAK